MEDLLRTHHTSLAAVIIEPVVQGIQYGREILNQWSFMLVMWDFPKPGLITGGYLRIMAIFGNVGSEGCQFDVVMWYKI